MQLTQGIKVDKLETGIPNELKTLINLRTIPDLEIKQMIDGVRYEVDDNMILKQGESYFVNFNCAEEEVGLVITHLKLQPPYITEEDAGQWLGIIIQGGYPVKFLLGAAIAIYAARLCGTKIYDEDCFWSEDRENDFDTFLEFVKSELTSNDCSSENLQIASEKFYNALPKGKG